VVEAPKLLPAVTLSGEILRAQKRWRLTRIYIPALSAAAVLISAAIFLFLAHRSLADIYVAGIPVKVNDSQQQLQQEINSFTSIYRLKLLYPDGQSKNYPLNQVGVSVDGAASAAAAKKAINHSSVGRLTWWRPMRLQLVTKIDEPVFDNFVSNHGTVALKPAKDAALTINNSVVSLTPETTGTGSRILHPKTAITQAIAALSSSPIKLQATSLQPSIDSKDLAKSQAKIEAMLAQKITLTINGQTITPQPADIGSWLDLNSVPSAKTVDVTVNSGKVLQYINRIARPFIQPPRSRLVTQAADGSTAVLDVGASGTDVINKDQTAAAIAQALTDDKNLSLDLPIAYAPAQTVEVQPAAKWLVVDVITKRMYAYEWTNLVRTFLISAGAPRTPTVLGQYAIYAKYASQDMRGANADGSRYFQPAVPYVNYFYKDYAVHGNYWRPLSYFGNINSSHGCVGTMVPDAAWIYQWAPVGTPVIVHK